MWRFEIQPAKGKGEVTIQTFKIKVLKYVEQTSNREAVRKYDIDEKNVCRWKLMQKKLEN